ncbi:predicted protein [Plenodomus lingam JN3]|uniref:Predicted protein n=1 Tax=Leptosphaeria maculans (strain JN3 / isolate v23.1.3 / race Av1-4-5-6-7-8) TaxID=985895 RepID=E5R530_LEPMJ|nr:predicted protein [Plenodomus lingam JN3]CBX92000.1 predicted protein [Plenodomus lingam JN3]
MLCKVAPWKKYLELVHVKACIRVWTVPDLHSAEPWPPVLPAFFVFGNGENDNDDDETG